MIRMYKDEETSTAVLKKALFLAWQACGGASGMGVFQDNPAATEDDVWNRVHSPGDYCCAMSDTGDLNADYVFGRMMKLRVQYSTNKIDVPESTLSLSYQGWCGTFETYNVLFDAAEKAVGL